MFFFYTFRIPKKSDKDSKDKKPISTGSSLQKPASNIKTTQYNNSYGGQKDQKRPHPFYQQQNKKSFEDELVKAMEKPQQKTFDVMNVISGMKTLEKSNESQFVKTQKQQQLEKQKQQQQQNQNQHIDPVQRRVEDMMISGLLSQDVQSIKSGRRFKALIQLDENRYKCMLCEATVPNRMELSLHFKSNRHAR